MPPFLERYLPFWLANLMARMGVVIVPLIALSRILPPLYNWRLRYRVYRCYGQLRAVKTDIDAMDAESAGTSDDMPP